MSHLQLPWMLIAEYLDTISCLEFKQFLKQEPPVTITNHQTPVHDPYSRKPLSHDWILRTSMARIPKSLIWNFALAHDMARDFLAQRLSIRPQVRPYKYVETVAIARMIRDELDNSNPPIWAGPLRPGQVIPQDRSQHALLYRWLDRRISRMLDARMSMIQRLDRFHGLRQTPEFVQIDAQIEALQKNITDKIIYYALLDESEEHERAAWRRQSKKRKALAEDDSDEAAVMEPIAAPWYVRQAGQPHHPHRQANDLPAKRLYLTDFSFKMSRVLAAIETNPDHSRLKALCRHIHQVALTDPLDVLVEE